MVEKLFGLKEYLPFVFDMKIHPLQPLVNSIFLLTSPEDWNI